MKSKYLSTKNILTAFFILSIIYTTLQLFSLQDDLILSSSSLTSSDIASIGPVLQGLYISVTLMILFGLLTLIVIFRTQGSADDVAVFLDKKNGSKIKKTEDIDETEKKSTLDLSFIKDKISSIKDEKEKYQLTLTELCKKLEIGQGAIYMAKESKETRSMEFYMGYAFSKAESETISFEFGEGLVGQVAKEGETLVIDEIPDNYINVISGLGNASPNYLLIVPLIKDSKTYGVVEMASFVPFEKENIALISESFGLLEVKKPEAKTLDKNAPKGVKKEIPDNKVSKKGKEKK